jgi:surface antigen
MWAINASKLGYTVSSTPAVGTIAQTTAGALGHVAYVIAVSGNKVQVEEENYVGFGIISTRWTNLTDWVYIYY